MAESAHVDQSPTHGQPTNESPGERSVRTLLTTPRAIRFLAGLVLAAILGDLATTMYGLEVGFREQNPFVAFVLARVGVAGLVGLKLFVIGWIAVIWAVLGRLYGVAAMIGVLLPQSIAVFLNVLTLLGL